MLFSQVLHDSRHVDHNVDGWVDGLDRLIDIYYYLFAPRVCVDVHPSNFIHTQPPASAHFRALTVAQKGHFGAAMARTPSSFYAETSPQETSE